MRNLRLTFVLAVHTDAVHGGECERWTQHQPGTAILGGVSRGRRSAPFDPQECHCAPPGGANRCWGSGQLLLLCSPADHSGGHPVHAVVH